MIKDSVIGRGGALPLFKRGVERERFDRAREWLLRDIEQLMLFRGIPYEKKRGMLGNLKALFSYEESTKIT
jgi:hypothetical protein